MNSTLQSSNLVHTLGNTKQISLRNKGKLFHLPIDQIEYIQAARNYSIIYAQNGKFWVSSKTLLAFDESLNEHQFLRLHRSYLVNISVVVDCLYDNDSLVVILKNDKKIMVSRRQVKRVKSTFGNTKPL